MDPQIQALIDAINKLSGNTQTGGQANNPALNQLVSIRVILTAILSRMGGSALNGRGGGKSFGGGTGGKRFGSVRNWLGKQLGKSRISRHVAGLVSGEAGGAAAARTGIGAGAAEGAMAAGALGAVGVAGGIVIGTLVAVTKEMRDIAREQLEESRRLGKVSPSQALITAQLDINRMFRDLQKGERTADTSKDLAEATNRLEKALLPFESTASDFKNFITGVVTDWLGAGVEKLNQTLKEMPGKIGLFFQIALRDGQEGGNTMAEDLNRIFGQEKDKIDDAWKKKEAVRKQQEQDRFRGMPGWAGGR